MEVNQGTKRIGVCLRVREFSLEVMYSLNLFSDAKNMARDVHTILIDIAQAHGDMTAERASAFVKELTQKGRYSQEVWS